MIQVVSLPNAGDRLRYAIDLAVLVLPVGFIQPIRTMVNRTFRHLASPILWMAKRARGLLPRMEYAGHSVASTSLGPFNKFEWRGGEVLCGLGQHHPHQCVTHMPMVTSLSRRPNTGDGAMALATGCHHPLAHGNADTAPRRCRKLDYGQSWPLGVACHHREPIPHQPKPGSMDGGRYAPRRPYSKRHLRGIRVGSRSIGTRCLVDLIRLVAMGTFLLSGPTVVGQPLNQARFIQSCLARCGGERTLHHAERDSIRNWLIEALEKPHPFALWPRDQLEQIPCLRRLDAFRMGAYIAQLGTPKDPLEWQAMGLDSLAQLGMRLLFTLSNPHHNINPPTWVHLAYRPQGVTINGRWGHFFWGPSVRWPGWLTIHPGQGWDWHPSPWRWTFHPQRGHSIIRELPTGQVGWQSHPAGGLWHLKQLHRHGQLALWGDHQLIHGVYLKALFPYGVYIEYGTTRPNLPWTASSSIWRQNLRNGTFCHIPYWGGTLSYRHLEHHQSIQWQNREFMLRMQSTASHRAMSIRRFTSSLDWTFILGDAQGVAISVQQRQHNTQILGHFGWLSGQTQNMWFGDPLTMRSAGGYVGMSVRGDVPNMRWQTQITCRPSGWAWRIGVRYTIASTPTRIADHFWQRFPSRPI